MTAQLLIGGYIVLSILGTGLLLMILASAAQEKTRWRECIGCGRFFNEMGETRCDPPMTMNVGPCGTCHECSVALDMGVRFTPEKP